MVVVADGYDDGGGDDAGKVEEEWLQEEKDPGNYSNDGDDEGEGCWK